LATSAATSTAISTGWSSGWSSGHVDYVNLGDSYSAGFGSGTLRAGPFPECLQGTGPSHVTELAALPNVRLSIDAACAGTTPANIAVIAGNVSEQLAGAELVTLTLGGNDLDLGALVKACSTQGTDLACDRAVAMARQALPFITTSVRSTLQQIDAETPGRILVLGYPRLFSPQYGDNALITARRARQLNRLADALNRAVRAGTRGNDARFISVTGAFNRHGLGSPDPWIYFNLANPGDPFNLHPTTTGYLQGYYPAVKRHARLHHLAH
jgi:lysophospholipase L1-like esterase